MVQYLLVFTLAMLKLQVQKLRSRGKTYSEIQKILHVSLPKSTLSDWCKNISLNSEQRTRIALLVKKNSRKAQKRAVTTRSKNRSEYLSALTKSNVHLVPMLKNKKIAKIVLATLYAAEGTKGKRGFLTFGNSDPHLIKLFLRLLRDCYTVDIKKFRCTLQCRADSPIPTLERFWVRTTGIPYKQFYKARIDPRTIGKKTQKPNYRGVCRLDYFSAHIYNELTIIMKLLTSAK